MTLLSIITIGINKKEILKTIDSYEQFINKEFCEIIIVKTRKLGDLNIKGNNLKIFYDDGKGPYNAMNIGLKKSTGKYIWFLNSGDKAIRKNLNNLIFALKDSTDSFILFSDDFHNFINKFECLNFKVKNIYNLLLKLQISPVNHQNIIIKSKFHKPFDTSYKISSDFSNFLKVLKKTNSSLRLFPFSIAYLSPGGLSDKNRKLAFIERYLATKRVYKKTIYVKIAFQIRLIYLFTTNIIKFFIQQFRKW